MSSNAGITIHGLINRTHTSQLNAQYAPNNIPTPWPLITLSSLLSFIICCFGALATARSLKGQTTRTTNIPLRSLPPPIYTQKDGNFIVSPGKLPTTKRDRFSFSVSFSTTIYYLTFTYCIFRAITSLIITLSSLQNSNTSTPLPAPSSILLALLSTQILYTNPSYPPLPRLILLLSILILSLSFGISSYAPNLPNSDTHTPPSSYWPRYSTLSLSSPNCGLSAPAVYAGDCLSQAPHWLSVGCGNWTTQANFDSGVTYGFAEWFVTPYRNTGDLNSRAGMNSLHATELAVVVMGTAWWCVVLWQLCEVFGLLRDCFEKENGGVFVDQGQRQRSVIGGLKSIFSSLFRFSTGNRNPTKPPTNSQQSLYSFVVTWGLFLAFLVMLMAIGGHTSQMMRKLSIKYIESFGPQVGTNFTFDRRGIIESSAYWGNETSWSDCFEIRAPGSRSGFWSEWVRSNRESGSLFRIAAGL